MSNNAPNSENLAAAATEPSAIAPPPTIVIVDTLSFQAALAKYVKVIANKNARPLVQGIRISAADDHIDLLGTDLEVTLHMAVPANAIITPISISHLPYYTSLFLVGEEPRCKIILFLCVCNLCPEMAFGNFSN